MKYKSLLRKVNLLHLPSSILIENLADENKSIRTFNKLISLNKQRLIPLWFRKNCEYICNDASLYFLSTVVVKTE